MDFGVDDATRGNANVIGIPSIAVLQSNGKAFLMHSWISIGLSFEGRKYQKDDVPDINIAKVRKTSLNMPQVP